MTWPHTGMYGRVGLADSPRPWLMIVRSCETVRALPTTFSAGTAGEIPPRPFGPWHCAHANWLKVCAPSATSALTLVVGGGCDATVTVMVFVLPHAARSSVAEARRTRRRRRRRRSIRRCYGAGGRVPTRETTVFANR